MSTDELVTVATFLMVHDGHLAKNFLEDAGLTCFLADEYLLSSNVHYSNITEGSRLQVPGSQQEEARRLLGEYERIKQDEGSVDWESVEDDWSGEPSLEGEQAMVCPACKSARVYSKPLSPGRVLAAVALLGAPLLVAKREWVCEQCEHEWKSSFLGTDGSPR